MLKVHNHLTLLYLGQVSMHRISSEMIVDSEASQGQYRSNRSLDQRDSVGYS